MTPKTPYTFWLLFLWTFLGFAQQKSSETTVNANVGYGHPTASGCVGYSGVCAIQTAGKSSKTNAVISYDKKRNLLKIKISKTDKRNTAKLLHNKTKAKQAVYTVDHNKKIPPEILRKLKIKGKTRIKKGTYTVKEFKDYVLLEVALE